MYPFRNAEMITLPVPFEKSRGSHPTSGESQGPSSLSVTSSPGHLQPGTYPDQSHCIQRQCPSLRQEIVLSTATVTLFHFLKIKRPTPLWTGTTNPQDKMAKPKAKFCPMFSPSYETQILTYSCLCMWHLTGKSLLKSGLFILSYKCDILWVFQCQRL